MVGIMGLILIGSTFKKPQVLQTITLQAPWLLQPSWLLWLQGNFFAVSLQQAFFNSVCTSMALAGKAERDTMHIIKKEGYCFHRCKLRQLFIKIYCHQVKFIINS